MMSCACCCSCRPLIVPKSSVDCGSSQARRNAVCVISPHGATARGKRSRFVGVRASTVDSYESSSDFVKRMEQAWLISQQPRPVACSSCNSKGHVECKWCGGTGFFILGDNMLCQVPSRNTSCVICAGKGSTCCSDCKGTGFRAKWLGEPTTSK
ncbi:uncharacterized protein LOC115687339 [Syzygium oleosum]|uniref:uncharacterized protein LOC115687339 n=1 Tax=Syzygium oleosum TaxID=219896 RepID=UPI0024B8CE4A|nr:uncharacterized protein LOC115687339 [Syzygium oleosum]